MTDARLTALLRICAAVGISLSLAATMGIFAVAGVAQWLTGFDAFVTILVVFFALFAWLAASHEPRNPVVWTMASSGLFGGLTQAGQVGAIVLNDLDPSVVYPIIPASLPDGAAWLLFLTAWMWVPALMPLLTIGLVLFPDGRLPSPRWRVVRQLGLLGLLALAIGSAWTYRPTSAEPADEGLAVIIPWLVVLTAAILSVIGLIVRFRRSAGETRQQIKWVLWGASVFIPVFLVLGFILGGGENEGILLVPVMSAEALFLASYGVAVVKYRLYDVDVVISRTLVYGALAVFIGGVYVGIVVGVGYLIGAQEEPNPWLGILATVIITIAFQPLRRKLQKLANRIVYGRRATPYEVLSSFSHGVSAVDPGVLAAVARSLAEGTTAASASIWIDRGDSLQCIAAWPGPVDDGPPAAGVSAHVIHDGERLGRVRLDIQPGQPFPVTDQRLLDQVAAGLGLALRNMLLTEDLRARVAQLKASRRRIVTVQDETRRRLERDLHDGAQQRLVALKIKLGIGSTIADKAGLDDVEELLDVVRDETDQTIDAVREFARGIYPPLLESEGLGPALGAQARKLPIPVTVQAPGLARYSKEIEATVYFCVLEGLQNAVKHSEASSVQVVIADRDGELLFEIRDDGAGFAVNEVAKHGLVNITDRVEAVGGLLEVESHPGRGSRVIGSVPIPELAVT